MISNISFLFLFFFPLAFSFREFSSRKSFIISRCSFFSILCPFFTASHLSFSPLGFPHKVCDISFLYRNNNTRYVCVCDCWPLLLTIAQYYCHYYFASSTSWMGVGPAAAAAVVAFFWSFHIIVAITKRDECNSLLFFPGRVFCCFRTSTSVDQRF